MLALSCMPAAASERVNSVFKELRGSGYGCADLQAAGHYYFLTYEPSHRRRFIDIQARNNAQLHYRIRIQGQASRHARIFSVYARGFPETSSEIESGSRPWMRSLAAFLEYRPVSPEALREMCKRQGIPDQVDRDTSVQNSSEKSNRQSTDHSTFKAQRDFKRY